MIDKITHRILRPKGENVNVEVAFRERVRRVRRAINIVFTGVFCVYD